MTLRTRIVNYLEGNPGTRYTNAQLAQILAAPLASVRRASLQALRFGLLDDGGPVSYDPNTVTYVAPFGDKMEPASFD